MSKEIDINDPFLAEKEAIRYVEKTRQSDKFSFVTGCKHAMKLVKESDSIDLVSSCISVGDEVLYVGSYVGEVINENDVRLRDGTIICALKRQPQKFRKII